MIDYDWKETPLLQFQPPICDPEMLDSASMSNCLLEYTFNFILPVQVTVRCCSAVSFSRIQRSKDVQRFDFCLKHWKTLKHIEKTLNNWITFAYWITRYNKINKNECRFDRIPRVGHSYHSWSEVCPLSRTSRDFRRWPSASNLARASALGVWNAIPPIVKERKLRLSKVHVSQPGNVLGFWYAE